MTHGIMVQRCLHVLVCIESFVLDIWRTTDPELGACSVN